MTRTSAQTLSEKTLSEQSWPLRPVRLGPPEVIVERRPDGTTILRSPNALKPYPQKLTERLAHWAQAAPVRSETLARLWNHMRIPVPTMTRIEPHRNAALSFWPSLNLPTGR